MQGILKPEALLPEPEAQALELSGLGLSPGSAVTGGVEGDNKWTGFGWLTVELISTEM